MSKLLPQSRTAEVAFGDVLFLAAEAMAAAAVAFAAPVLLLVGPIGDWVFFTFPGQGKAQLKRCKGPF